MKKLALFLLVAAMSFTQAVMPVTASAENASALSEKGEISHSLEIVWTQMRNAQNPVKDTNGAVTIDFTALVKNTGNTDVSNADLIAAVYGDDGRLLQCAKGPVSVSANGEAKVDFTVNCNTAYFDPSIDLYKHFDVKFFLWDGINTVKVLAKERETQFAASDYFTTVPINGWLSYFHLTTDAEVSKGLIGGAGGQLTYSLAVSPHNTDIILGGTDTVGVWRSTDGGDTWTNSSNGLSYGYMNDLLYDPENPGVVYAIDAGPQTAITQGSQDMGIYKSTDDGATWQQEQYAKYTLRALAGRDQLAWHTYNGTRYLYAATMGSGIIRRAVDKAGSAWETVYSSEDSFYDIYTKDNGIIIAAGSNGIIKSTDGGTTWESVPVTVDGNPLTLTCIEVDPGNENKWLSCDGTYLYISSNAGASWSKGQSLSAGSGAVAGIRFSGYKSTSVKNSTYRLFVTYNQASNALRYTDRYEKYNILYQAETPKIPTFEYADKSELGTLSYWAEVFDPTTSNGANVSMIGYGYATSTDGGATWSCKQAQGRSGVPMTDMEFDASGKPIWMSSIDAGVWKTESNNHDGALFPTIKQHNFVRFDGNGGYTYGSMSSSAVEIDPNNSDHLLAVTGEYGYGNKTAVVQSYDGGASWAPIQDASGNNISENKGISFLKYDPTNSNVIYAGYLKSTDNGATWSTMSPLFDDKYVDVCDISKSGKLLAFVFESNDYRNLYVSEDKGATWTPHTIKVSANYSELYNISSAVFDNTDENIVWVGNYAYLTKVNLTTNTGTQIKDGLFSPRQIAQNPNDPNHILILQKNVSNFKISGTAIKETFDGGATWHKVTDFPQISNPSKLVFHPTEPIVYISTYLGTIVYNYEYHRNYINSLG